MLLSKPNQAIAIHVLVFWQHACILIDFSLEVLTEVAKVSNPQILEKFLLHLPGYPLKPVKGCPKFLILIRARTTIVPYVRSYKQICTPLIVSCSLKDTQPFISYRDYQSLDYIFNTVHTLDPIILMTLSRLTLQSQKL